ncbi:Rhodanese-like domain protein [Tenacibaculum sp. 190130A14a]|uniref:YceI domain-containing protein n=1 Tax=Tenacibaculum polynesiense TaxID=3137857 RepID=A0ABP1EU53_9FLAO
MRTMIIIFMSAFFFITQSNAQEKLHINTTKSSIKWIGEYTFYFGGHDGFINFKEGHFVKTDGKITGGEFIIDMNSMSNSDIQDKKGKLSLLNHLKDPDFFDVTKYPLAQLKITKVEYFDTSQARIEANLTLKEITKPINFRASFNYERKEMKTRFKINRRLWNVNYTSKFKDGAISDGIGFEVSVKL